ncbi:MAG: hypothetical protein KAS32_26905 [Candidatus Peribacteraceae bacterium]|nr:hypothetical protein [Candidatus Peribacteraceae bacterium]
MKKVVQMCRISYSFTDIEVEAETDEEAIKTAYEIAGDCFYNEKSSEYEAQSITDVTGKED